MVHNPPQGVTDPDAYHKFFSRYGDVVFVTVALDNGQVLRLLRRKRELRPTLKQTAEGRALLEAEATGSELPSPAEVTAWSRFKYALGLGGTSQALLMDEYVRANERLRGLAHRSNRVRRVYIVFNTEQAKRACLKDMKAGVLARVLGDWAGLCGCAADSETRFEGKVLKVVEPVEPSEVLYENFDYSQTERALRTLLSTLFAGLLLIVSYYCLEASRYQSGVVSALIVSGINALLPVFMKTVVALVERHVDQSDVQDSILLKLVVARCLNTAVLKVSPKKGEET
jgi:hypothetical protein